MHFNSFRNRLSELDTILVLFPLCTALLSSLTKVFKAKNDLTFHLKYLFARYPEKDWNRLLKWKYSMCVLARKCCFSHFSSENDAKFGRKSYLFSLVLLSFKNFATRIQNEMVYISFTKTVGDFRHKNFENCSKKWPIYRLYRLFYFVNEVLLNWSFFDWFAKITDLLILKRRYRPSNFVFLYQKI